MNARIVAALIVGIGIAPCGLAAEPQSLDAIRTAAASLVRAALPHTDYPVSVTADPPDSRLRLGACAAPLAASRVTATLGARVLVFVACGSAWRVLVPVRIVTDLPVLVLRGPAQRGKELTVADVEVRRQRVAGLSYMYMSDVRQLAGQRLVRATPAGTALTAALFKAQPVVKRGQSVTLLASSAGVDIRAEGRALADGARHDRIRVQNLSSLKIVEGVVDDSGTVRVTP